MEAVTLKQFRAAFAAHNRRAEYPGGNDNYNVARGLGTFHARCICRHIAVSACGDGGARITMRQAETWARGMLPPGAGYAFQDIKPWMETVVAHLRGR